MTLQTYLSKVQQTYSYRFKTLVPLDDVRMVQFEDAIRKYRPSKVQPVIKTLLQAQPLDFGGHQNREVYIVDFDTELPASAYILQQDIRQHFGVPEEFVIVRASNEPTEVESLRINAFAEMDEEAKKKGMYPAPLLQQDNYPEAPEIKADRYYGNRYNNRLNAVLMDIKNTRKPHEVDPMSPLMAWKDMPKANSQEPKIPEKGFNDHIKDAPRPASDPKFKDPGMDSEYGVGRANSNNYDDDVKMYSRVYTDGKKTVTLTRTVTSTSKGKKK